MGRRSGPGLGPQETSILAGCDGLSTARIGARLTSSRAIGIRRAGRLWLRVTHRPLAPTVRLARSRHMKFPQLALGQRFAFQGELYTKIGPMTARRERDGVVT
jgi:hypothetical protein